MRFLIIILLLCLSTLVYCRPSIDQEADSSVKDDSEYESGGDDGQVDDALDDSDSRFAEEESSEDDEQEDEALQDQREQEPNGDSYSVQTTEDNPTRVNSDNISGYKNSKRRYSGQPVAEVNKSEYETPTKEQEANVFNENTGNHPESISNPERFADEKNLLNKQNPVPRMSNDVLCENNENKKNNVGNEFNEDSDPQEQVQYFNKYYNPLQEELSAEKTYENNINRDRRAAQDTNDTSLSTISNNNIEIDKSIDEEAIIKKHIKKLSGEELEELLNSLTEDKKELLKKIMENDVELENEINKREITKKAGAAADDTANLESGISDASKLQSGNPEAESSSQTLNTETTEATKLPNPQSELNVLPVTKTLEANNGTPSTSTNKENKAELFETSRGKSDSNGNTLAPLLETNNQVKDLSNIQEPKISSKREANSNSNFDYIKQHNSDFKDTEELSNESNNFYNQDEDLTQLLDEESKLNNEGNIMKREAFNKNDADFSESMKSLQESFPNSNSYDFNDPYTGSDLVPLVRVKRRNNEAILKKRAAGVLPDARVAYFPYRAGNDEEDSDEGNEFDDDGFYDRRSNLAKIDSKDDQPREDDTSNFQDIKLKQQSSQNNFNDKLIRSEVADTNNNMESDTMNLGSDTDSVLSGVEGVDDNLMYNSGTRNKRLTANLEGLNDNSVDGSNQISDLPMPSTPFEGTDAKSATENFVGAPNYHENDAFGPLPRNYDGELGRYKRIRRVKQDLVSSDK